MKIKRFVGNNMQEAIEEVKKELGRNAIILNTRNIKEGGFLGLFAKNRVEVIAAVKEEDERGSFKDLLVRARTDQERPQQKNYTRERKKELARSRYENLSKTRVEKKVAEKNNAPVKSSEVKAGGDSLKEEIRQLRMVVENSLLRSDTALIPEVLRTELNRLQEREVSKDITTRLATSLLEEKGLNFDDPDEIRSRIRQELIGLLPGAGPLEVNPGDNKVVALVGPTGVGKTTTLAKLAAGFVFEKKLDVGLITIDTYRIAAVEQLRTYADIMDIPLSVVFTPEEFKEALEDYSDMDLVLVDTAGRSPKNRMQMQELKNFLSGEEVDEVFLVLSLVAKKNDMLQAARAFAPLDISRVILTKLDETDAPGSVLDFLLEYRYRLSYVTTGQDVPEDIELLNPEKIVDLLIAG